LAYRGEWHHLRVQTAGEAQRYRRFGRRIHQPNIIGYAAQRKMVAVWNIKSSTLYGASGK